MGTWELSAKGVQKIASAQEAPKAHQLRPAPQLGYWVHTKA